LWEKRVILSQVSSYKVKKSKHTGFSGSKQGGLDYYGPGSKCERPLKLACLALYA
jgi:hypothetical protein